MTAAVRNNAPISLRISVTDHCQLRCLYCRPAEGNEICSQTGYLTFDEIAVFVHSLHRYYNLSKVRITGGEPLTRHGLTGLIERLSDAGISDIGLTTNGQLLDKMASSLKRAGLKRVNISLDSLHPDSFHRLTRGGDINRTLAGIEAAIECGISPVKINTVVLADSNDHEVADIASFGIGRNCQVRFLELMPIGASADHFNDWFVPSVVVMMKLSERFELHPLLEQSGSSSSDYMARDDNGKEGIIGFISPLTAPFCNGCRRLRLTADGRLLGCLAREEYFNLRTLLNGESCSNEALLTELVDSALSAKYKSHRFNSGREMVKIGG